jgi:hypothetical protein
VRRQLQIDKQAAESETRKTALRAKGLVAPLLDYSREFLAEYNEPRAKKIGFSGDYLWYGEGEPQVVKVFDGWAINQANDDFDWHLFSCFAITNAPGQLLYSKDNALKKSTWFPFTHRDNKSKGWSFWQRKEETRYRFVRFEYEAGELDNEYGTATYNFARCIVNFNVGDRYEAMELLHSKERRGPGYAEFLY